MNTKDDLTPQKSYIKLIKWDENLRTFLSILSERDRLMSLILYFTDLKISDVLKLKASQVYILELPKFIKNDLSDFIKDKKENSFVFLNNKKEPVERAHLTQAFNRVSRKMKGRLSLKPRDLCRWIGK